jgi:hypothetical protein
MPAGRRTNADPRVRTLSIEDKARRGRQDNAAVPILPQAIAA